MFPNRIKMKEIIEAEYIRIETEDESILKEVQRIIPNSYLYINRPNDKYLIRLKLRRFDFNALTYFKDELHSNLNELIDDSFVEEFLTVENELIDQDEYGTTTFPIPFEPILFRGYCTIILENYKERADKYIWILNNYEPHHSYSISGEIVKLSTLHTNFYWKDIDYIEERRDFCQVKKSNGEVSWLNLSDNLELDTDEVTIRPEKINIDNEMRIILNYGLELSKIAINNKLKIYKSN